MSTLCGQVHHNQVIRHNNLGECGAVHYQLYFPWQKLKIKAIYVIIH